MDGPAAGWRGGQRKRALLGFDCPVLCALAHRSLVLSASRRGSGMDFIGAADHAPLVASLRRLFQLWPRKPAGPRTDRRLLSGLVAHPRSPADPSSDAAHLGPVPRAARCGTAQLSCPHVGSLAHATL